MINIQWHNVTIASRILDYSIEYNMVCIVGPYAINASRTDSAIGHNMVSILWPN